MMNQNILVSYLDTSVDDMVEVRVNWRAKALEFAKGKMFVSLKIKN